LAKFKPMRKLLISTIACLLTITPTITLFTSFKDASTDKNPLWMRYPSISPDGKTIAFSYKGDLYKVAATGGTAEPITLSEGHDFMPVWSPDGKQIAFASDRSGNYDVYLMSSEGGPAKRLTFNSSNDYPYCFSPDGSSILFSSARMKSSTSAQFPSNRMPELYSVNTDGSKETQLFSTPAEDAKYSKDGNRILFQDKKGYEDPFRKHHVSPITRDIWMYSKNDNSFKKLTGYEGEDRNPIWSADEKDMYYLSEKSGSFNVWKQSLDNVTQSAQLTKFEKNPVRFLSSSSNGTLCFGFNGEIYTMASGSQPAKINIRIATDERFNPVQNEVTTTGATEMAVSPDGKEVAFVVRGEVFVTSTEGGITKRITNTPEQERNISFSPDGRSILYASERNHIWGLYQSTIARNEEDHFFNSTLLNEETILENPAKEAFQPQYSPDGKEVAYLEDRVAVNIIDLKTKAIRNILPASKNYSYEDGDQWFDWSPDGKYLLVQFLEDNNWLGQIGLIESSGKGKLVDLTHSGFDNNGGKWMLKGDMMIWYSNRHGMKNASSHGSQADVYGLFFNQAALDRFNLNKEDYQLLTEKEDKEKEKKDKEKKEDSKDKATKDKTEIKLPDPIKIELNNIDDRKVRLTIHSSDLADAVLSKDGEKLYYLCKFEKGYDLWVNTLREHETKMLIKLESNKPGSLTLDKEGKNLFVISDGKMLRINLDKAERKDIAFKAEMNLNLSAERSYLFEHAWRQALKKFYVTDMQKVDWNYYHDVYAKFLPYINNNRDFAELLSEMLGELNASHTGGRFSPHMNNPDETASLGLLFDEKYNGSGLRIAEVIAKGPLVLSSSTAKAGTILEKIDGVPINASESYFQQLNRKAGKYTLLSFYDESSKKHWDETVKPISTGALNELLYQRWVKQMQNLTDKLSNGKLGYVHVRGMNDESFRDVYEQALGKLANKEALIVDTRYNGGGWLHDDLATFLSGKKYIEFIPREQKVGPEPQTKWIKPSAVLISEGNYSDAHMFPYVYKTLGIGKLIGMPMAGTGTAVWWETLQDPTLVFGIPEVGVVGLDGKYLENQTLTPDIQVQDDFNTLSGGRDQQLEAAVNELLKGSGK